MQDLSFQKAVTVRPHEQEQLVPDAFGAFPAGTAKVWLLPFDAGKHQSSRPLAQIILVFHRQRRAGDN